MNLQLFPVNAGIWDLGTTPEFDAALYGELLRVNQDMRTGAEIWDRRSHNIFDGSLPEADRLKALVMPVIQSEFIGPNGRVASMQGREVVRYHGTEIMPHCDEDECHLQAVYFPCGAEIDAKIPLLPQINSYGDNAFAICNPDWRSSGFGGYRMPWEHYAKFWVKPHRGLLIAFDARAVHFQKPYLGDKPFMQILFNIKVETIA
jgi:hypothetical protein